MGVLTWAGFSWFYLGGPVTWDLARMGGIGLALGFGLAALLNVRGLTALLISAISVYLPIYASYRNQCSQLYLCFDGDGNLLTNFSPAPAIAVGILAGGIAGALLRQRLIHEVRQRESRLEQSLINLQGVVPSWLGRILMMSAALLLVLVLWGMVAAILQTGAITWDEVSLLFSLAFAISMVASTFVGSQGQVLFVGTGIALWWGINQQVGDAFSRVLVAPQAGASSVEALFSYDNAQQVFSVGAVGAFVIALFATLPSLYQGLQAWIGQARTRHEERDGWASFTLGLVLALGALIAVFAPFSMHVDGVLALAWGGLGFVLFVVALATWRWARWGGIGLVGALCLLSLASALRDANSLNLTDLMNAQQAGGLALWMLLLLVALLSSLRRAVWSGALWAVTLTGSLLVSFFAPNTSWTLLSLTLSGGVLFALLPHWSKLEAGRWQAPWGYALLARTRTRTIPQYMPALDSQPVQTAVPTVQTVEPLTLPVVTAPLPNSHPEYPSSTDAGTSTSTSTSKSQPASAMPRLDFSALGLEKAPAVPKTLNFEREPSPPPEKGSGTASAVPKTLNFEREPSPPEADSGTVSAVPKTVNFERQPSLPPEADSGTAPEPKTVNFERQPSSPEAKSGTAPEASTSAKQSPVTSTKPPSMKFDFGLKPMGSSTTRQVPPLPRLKDAPLAHAGDRAEEQAPSAAPEPPVDDSKADDTNENR
jgi:hypothetical protein